MQMSHLSEQWLRIRERKRRRDGEEEEETARPVRLARDVSDERERALDDRQVTRRAQARLENPAPPYAHFGAVQFTDEDGRQYRLLRKEEHPKTELLEAGELGADITDLPVGAENLLEARGAQFGRQVMYVRLPRQRRGLAPPTDQLDVEIMLMHSRSHINCSGVLDRCYFVRGSRTGYVVLNDFISWGQIAEYTSLE